MALPAFTAKGMSTQVWKYVAQLAAVSAEQGMEAAPKVLVIDDDPSTARAMALHLEFRGFRVEQAATGQDGLDRLRGGGADIVLCDVGLPDMTGHEVVQRVVDEARDSGRIPPEFVVLTANASLDNAIAALREGAFQFVAKPVSTAFLEVVVDRALEMARLRREVGTMSQERDRLVLQAVEALTSSLGLVGTLEAVLGATTLLLSPLRAAVWLVDRERGELAPVTVRHGDERVELSEQHAQLAREVFDDREIRFADGADSRFGAAPILDGDAAEGAITIELPTDEALAEDASRELLESLARHAANAVRKERLYADLEQSAMQLSTLFQVGLAMSSEVSLQALFEVIVDSAVRICGAERCSLMLVEPDGETMRIRAARGIPPEIVAQAVAQVGDGIAGSVAASGQALFISDIESHSRFSKRNDARYNNTSLVCVPILVSDQVVGVLNVNNKRGGQSFTENDLNLMTLLASQAAVAIDNAHRYQDLTLKATLDGLTGAYIRRTFDEQLDRFLRAAQTSHRPFTLLMLDIDHFKRVNDTYGHPAGDEALRSVAGLLKQAVRDEDFVARYGGEEFAVILAGVGSDVGERVAERIRAAVESTRVHYEDLELALTISIGVAAYADDVTEPDEMVRRADEALYAAKEGGRNRVVVAAAEKAEA